MEASTTHSINSMLFKAGTDVDAAAARRWRSRLLESDFGVNVEAESS
jgi:hypothetical protein